LYTTGTPSGGGAQSPLDNPHRRAALPRSREPMETQAWAHTLSTNKASNDQCGAEGPAPSRSGSRLRKPSLTWRAAVPCSREPIEGPYWPDTFFRQTKFPSIGAAPRDRRPPGLGEIKIGTARTCPPTRPPKPWRRGKPWRRRRPSLPEKDIGLEGSPLQPWFE